MRTPHLWKKTRGVVRETGVEEARAVSCGYIGLGCDFFVQPLFSEAESFDGDTARVCIDNTWRSLTAAEISAMDPFRLPE